MAAALLASTAAAAGPAGPADIGSLSLEQRATLLPPETVVVFRGKNTTIGALRTAHAALLAHFASLGGLKPSMPPFKRVLVTKTIDRSSPGLLQTNTISAGSNVSSPVTPQSSPMQHVPNGSPRPQPIDYLAACGKISLCVYIPPFNGSYESAGQTTNTSSLVITDPLLSADVCQQDGGSFSYSVCNFTYMYSAHISVFFGSPPNVLSSINCPSHAFSTMIDPLGAAAITGNMDAISGEISSTAGIVCAVDLEVPASS
jgi:hypothetical protein